MSRNRFEALRNNVHLVNEKPPNEDRLWKVRPILDLLLRRCHQLIFDDQLCIDEQIIPFKGQLSIKQYIKNKPSPWGRKKLIFFVAIASWCTILLCIRDKRYHFKIMSSEYGVTGATVLHLVNRIPTNRNYRLFADHYFTSIPVIKKFAQKKFGSLVLLEKTVPSLVNFL